MVAPYSIGHLFETNETRKWSPEQRALADAWERRCVFRNFRKYDWEGSRTLVRECGSEKEAKELVAHLNRFPCKDGPEDGRLLSVVDDVTTRYVADGPHFEDFGFGEVRYFSRHRYDLEKTTSGEFVWIYKGREGR